jgi:hypothetical protein
MVGKAQTRAGSRRWLWLAAILLIGAILSALFIVFQGGESSMNPGKPEGTSTPAAGGDQPAILASDALKAFETAGGSAHLARVGDELQVTFTCDALEIAYCYLGTPERPGMPLAGSGIPGSLGQRFLEAFPKNTSVYRCSKPAAADSPIRCEVAAQGSADWAPVTVRE